MAVGLEAPESAMEADRTTGGASRYDLFTFESWGWSSDPDGCAPKVTALASLVNLAPPDPVASVSYQSRGNLLIVAGDFPDRAHRAAESLAARLPVTVLQSGARRE